MATVFEQSSQKLWVSGYPGMEIDLGEGARTFSDEEFLDFCRRNPDARIERNSDGEIEIMAPSHTETGGMNADITFFLTSWARQDGTGRTFESSTGFTLPNRALRAPDASWISDRRWNVLSDEDRSGFAQISPDFVVELRSQSDTLGKLKAKMREYIENGSSLGWLIDPIERKVHVYRQGEAPEILNDPAEVAGEPVLKGFVLKMNEIWG
ncbi:MAG: Uma2 family endonuclease [Pyrinomonadaceae bacterium]